MHAEDVCVYVRAGEGEREIGIETRDRKTERHKERKKSFSRFSLCTPVNLTIIIFLPVFVYDFYLIVLFVDGANVRRLYDPIRSR